MCERTALPLEGHNKEQRREFCFRPLLCSFLSADAATVPPEGVPHVCSSFSPAFSSTTWGINRRAKRPFPRLFT